VKEPRFLADDMLARLARWLRGAGLDVLYLGRGIEDDRILRRARAEGRMVLTRDSRFPGGAWERIVIESPDLEEQLVEVLRRYPEYDPLARSFSRCMECNGRVTPEDDPPDRPEHVHGPFTRCEECGRLFWEGTHVVRVRARLARVRDRVADVLEEEKKGVPRPFERREYDDFLHEAFLLLGLSWRGYRKVRFGLRTRLRKRLFELGLGDLDQYLHLLRRDTEERWRLGTLLRVTISRFFRDRQVWLQLPDLLFPRLVHLAGDGPVRVWSLGCASGEEPFTLRMVWESSSIRERPLELLATDLSGECLRRAAAGLYPESAVHCTPEEFRASFFRREGESYHLRRSIIEPVRLEKHDWRDDEWPGPFHWILARNGPFTYPNEEGRRRILRKIESSLDPAGFLWVGGNERLPGGGEGWERVAAGLYKRVSSSSAEEGGRR